MVKLFVDNFEKREQEEAATSGISPEETHGDALADIIERSEEADKMPKKQINEKKSKNEVGWVL